MFKVFSLFKKKKAKPDETLLILGNLVYELLESLQDNKIDEKEREVLKGKAYKILLKLGLDSEEMIRHIRK